MKCESYYEWAIDDWDEAVNEIICSPCFNIGGYRWIIQIYKEGSAISLSLNNLEKFPFNEEHSIDVRVAFSIRNSNDFSCFDAASIKYVERINEKTDRIFFDNFTYEDNLFIPYKKINKSLIENSRVVIGVFLRIFQCSRDKKLVSQITSPVTSIQESDSFDDNIKNENKRTLPEESYNFNDYDKKKLKILEEDNVNVKRDELVIALYDFNGNSSHEINFIKGEKLRVVDWKAKEGWVYGYSVYSPQRKGFFPKMLVRLCQEDVYKDGDCVVALYDFKGNNSHELDFNKNDKITILDWHAKEGWAYGFIHNQSNAHVKKGLIPKLFIEMIPIEKHEIGETKKEMKNEEYVLALYDFVSKNSEELTIQRNEKLKVLDWNFKEDWIYGSKTSDPEKRGIFPKLFVRRI
jgi:hypothetical protein